MKMKHIIALCLILTLVLPSTALAASSHSTPKLTVKVVKHGDKTVTASYLLTGAKEATHTWSFGDGFTCHCKHRTHTYSKHGTYKICINLKTTSGHRLVKCYKVTV